MYNSSYTYFWLIMYEASQALQGFLGSFFRGSDVSSQKGAKSPEMSVKITSRYIESSNVTYSVL